VPYKCIKCGYETGEFEGKECPDCGGALKETNSDVDWLDAKEEKDLNDPNKDAEEKEEDDIPL
jgi:predicted  nucleic acid-binding Zn-ribbon protein